jgi:enoyl-CoA hydratase/carnithine racemase
MQDESRLRVEIEDGIAWVVFDNPRRHNALTEAMLCAIPRAAEALQRDDAVRVVVLRGAGERAFVSGADLRSLPEIHAAHPTRAMYEGAGAGALLEIQKPVVAMIHGHCIGGGILLAMCADLRIASDDARFGVPAARLGVGYPYDGVAELVRFVGPGAAAEILLVGEPLDASAALRTGLVTRVVPKPDLEAHVREVAARIAANAPLSLRAAKAAIRHAAGDPTAPDRDTIERWIAACWRSADLAEGRRAFLEKRPPRFRGD